MAPLLLTESCDLSSYASPLPQRVESDPAREGCSAVDETICPSLHKISQIPPSILDTACTASIEGINFRSSEISSVGNIISRSSYDRDITTNGRTSTAILPVLIILPVVASLLGVYIYYRGLPCRQQSIQHIVQDEISSNETTRGLEIQSGPVEEHDDTEIRLGRWIDCARKQGIMRPSCDNDGNAMTEEEFNQLRQRYGGSVAKDLVMRRSRRPRKRVSNVQKNSSGLDGSSDEILEDLAHNNGAVTGRIHYNLKIATQQSSSANPQSQELPTIIVTPPSPCSYSPIIDAESTSPTGDASQFLTVPESDDSSEELDTVNLVAYSSDVLADISNCDHLDNTTGALCPELINTSLITSTSMGPSKGFKSILNGVADKLRRLRSKSPKFASTDHEHTWMGTNNNPWSDNMDSSADINPWLSEPDQVRVGEDDLWTDGLTVALGEETESEWLARTRAQQRQQRLEEYVRDHPKGRDKPSQSSAAKVTHHRSGTVLKLECISETEDIRDNNKNNNSGGEMSRFSGREVCASEETFGTVNRSGSGYEGGSEESG
ncbi:hypothetical protein B7463_g8265, partial [Scytalidium lignicola]